MVLVPYLLLNKCRLLDKTIVIVNKINITFHVPEDPQHAVARGTGLALKNIDNYSFLMR